MSLLRKIFRSQKPDPFAGLRPRPPRVRINPLHRIHFRLIDDHRQMKILNISIGGMAVLHEKNPAWVEGAAQRGIIFIDQREMEIEARIRHVGEVLAGCEFSGVENLELRRAIESYLRVEILALTLHPVAEGYLQSDPKYPDAIPHWFTDGNQNEIYCITDDDGIISFHATFLGNYIEGARGSALKFGLVRESSTDSPGHKGSSLVDFSAVPSREVMNLAATFIKNIERMPTELRTQLETFFSQGK